MSQQLYLVQLPNGTYRLSRGGLRNAVEMARQIARSFDHPSAIRPGYHDWLGNLQAGDTSHVVDPDGSVRREVRR